MFESADAHSPRLGGKRPEAVSFRADIEGLRGLAILLVVLFHAKVPGVTGGFVGVDVFFVLSGYLITGLLITEWDTKGRIALLRFFARRVARLLPAATLTILATLAAAWFLLSPFEQARAARIAMRAAIYLSNISFARNLNYFDGAEDDLLLHTWSLAVEEQYYLVWPFLIVMSAYLGSLRSQFSRLALLAAIMAMSFAWCQWQMRVSPAAAFFLMPGRAWEFAIGGLVRIAPLGKLRLSPILASGLGAIGLFLIAGSAIGLSSRIPYPGYAVLLPVIGTAAVLATGTVAPSAGALCLLGLPPMRWLGKVSYSWYLWHWPVLVFALLVSTTPPAVSLPIACVLSLALATLCFHFVEAPLRRLGQALPRHGLVVAIGLVLSVGSALAGYVMERFAAASLREPRFVALESLRKDRSAAVHECQVPYTVAQPHPCPMGDVAATRQVWLVGDSKAAQWASALDTLGREYGWSVTLLSKGGCPIEDLPDFYLPRIRRVFSECSQWRREVLAQVQAHAPSLVIVAASKNYVTGADSPFGLDEWEAAAVRTYRALRSGGSELIVLRDTPSFSHNVPDCLGRPGVEANGGVRCGVSREMAAPTRLYDRTLRALAAVGGHSVDLTDVFCEQEYCGPYVQGKPGYTDADHISATLSKDMAPELGRAIVSAVPKFAPTPLRKQ